MAHAFLPMTAAQRAAMLDALANPVRLPGPPPYAAQTPGQCCCTCAGCAPWQPCDDAEDYRRRRGHPPRPPIHCRHILFCGLGGPIVETELTDADIEFLET